MDHLFWPNFGYLMRNSRGLPHDVALVWFETLPSKKSRVCPNGASAHGASSFFQSDKIFFWLSGQVVSPTAGDNLPAPFPGAVLFSQTLLVLGPAHGPFDPINSFSHPTPLSIIIFMIHPVHFLIFLITLTGGKFCLHPPLPIHHKSPINR